jgi:hypothetical protein
MAFFGQPVRIVGVLLEFYVGCDRGRNKNLLIVSDVDRQDKQTAAAPDNPGPSSQAAARRGAQIMNR